MHYTSYENDVCAKLILLLERVNVDARQDVDDVAAERLVATHEHVAWHTNRVAGVADLNQLHDATASAKGEHMGPSPMMHNNISIRVRKLLLDHSGVKYVG